MNRVSAVPSRMASQRGMTLLVGLIMLLLMTVIGMAAIRGSSMQELMAGNMRDRNLAFQAAEAGLRAAEDVLNGATLPAFDGSVAGYVQDLDGSARTGYWDSYNWNASALTSMSLDRVKEQPRFVIEEVSSTVVNAGSDGGGIDFLNTLKSEDIVYYRATSRGVGGTDNAVVIVQSTFKR